MKKLLCAMLLAIAGNAQSQTVPCGARQTLDSAQHKPPAAEPPGQSANREAGPAPPQIQDRRPAPSPFVSTCRCGVVGAASLTVPANLQQVPILTDLPGTFRLDHVLLEETGRFVSDRVRTLEVGMGRPNSPNEMISAFALKSDTAPYHSWYARLVPPQLSGAYDIVLSFKGSSLLGNGAASNFTAGELSWEICGYNSSRPAVK